MKRLGNPALIEPQKLCFVMSCVILFGLSITVNAADEIFETFDNAANPTIDNGGINDEAPAQMSGTGFSWGGYVDSGGAIDIKGTNKLQVKNFVPGEYTYTIFDSSGGNSSNTSVDLTIGQISMEVQLDSDASATPLNFSYMVRNGAGNWYVSDQVMVATDATRQWGYVMSTEQGADTWTPVTGISTMDALTGGDEGPITLGAPGQTPILSSVDGFGIYVRNNMTGGAFKTTIWGAKLNAAWQSNLVNYDASCKLQYFVEPAKGHMLPDWSHAGYRGGEAPLPNNIPTVHEITSLGSTVDNRQHIQDAIDYVSALPIQPNGYRGALLLKAGQDYLVYGGIVVAADGVVLRGEGEGSDPSTNTVIRRDYDNYPNVSNRGDPDDDGYSEPVVQFQGLGSSKLQVMDGSHMDIVGDVPVGGRVIEIDPAQFAAAQAGGNPFAVGDSVTVDVPDTVQWHSSHNSNQWSGPGDVKMNFCRYIESIDATANPPTITLKEPIFTDIKMTWHDDIGDGQPTLGHADTDLYLRGVGMEDIRVTMDTGGSGTERHTHDCVQFSKCLNVWARRCTVLHFPRYGFRLKGVVRATIQDCEAREPHSPITGGRRYNFAVEGAQLILFERCTADDSRHPFISNGQGRDNGIVELDSFNTNTRFAGAGHRRWCTGWLLDRVVEDSSSNAWTHIEFQHMNSGHGWGNAFALAWNCDMGPGDANNDTVPSGQNYAIGVKGQNLTGNGYWEGKNKPGLHPSSLYLAQLTDRLGALACDATPPDPNAMTWAIDPAVVSETAIEMTATVANDAGGSAPAGVLYYFECTSGGGPDSGWQFSPYFMPLGLTPNTMYTYTVVARDRNYTKNNITAPSSALSATTLMPDLLPPPIPAWIVSPAVSQASAPLGAISMTAAVVVDPEGNGPVSYYFTETSGNPGGDDSGWLATPFYEDTGLQQNTTYTYTVKVRDGSANQNESLESAGVPVTTTPYSLYISFQSDGSEIPMIPVVPNNYLFAHDELYGLQPNTQTLGWLAMTGKIKDSGSNPDPRLDTYAEALEAWEVEVPNGNYRIKFVTGEDGGDHPNNVYLEGTLLTDPDGPDPFDEYTNVLVTVSDGRLTLEDGNNGVVYTSPDGIVWSSVTTTAPVFNSVVWTGAQLVAATNNDKVFTSPDGITWTESAAGVRYMRYGLAYDGAMLLGVGNHGTITTSSDGGSTWNVESTDTTETLYDIAYSATAGRYVAVGGNGVITSTAIPTNAWTNKDDGTTQDLFGVVWAESLGLWVAAGGDEITYSTDSTTWTVISSPLDKDIYDIAWNGTVFCVVGKAGRIATSVDGINWVVQVSGVGFNMKTITTDGAQFIISGDGDELIASTDNGVIWWIELNNTDAFLKDSLWTGTQFVAVGTGMDLPRFTYIDIEVDTGATDFDDWQAYYFTAGEISGGDADRANDFDGDGFSNEEEYYFGIDPKNSGNANQPDASSEFDTGKYYPGFTYTRRKTAPGVVYTVQTCDDLAGWTAATRDDGGILADTYTVISVTDNVDGTEEVKLRYNVDFDLLSNERLFFRAQAVE